MTPEIAAAPQPFYEPSARDIGDGLVMAVVLVVAIVVGWAWQVRRRGVKP